MTDHLSSVRWLTDSPELLQTLDHIEILYTDLDGTLLGKGGTLLVDGAGNASTATADAVVRANQADLTIVPVTGRSRIQTTEIVRMCGWSDFIAEAGAIRSYWNGVSRENIWEVSGWSPAVFARMEAAGATPLDMIRQAGALDALREAFPGRVEHHEPWHMARECTDVLRGYLDREAAQVVLDQLDLGITLVDNGVINPRSHTLDACDEPIRAYHLVPTGTSKAAAIRADLHHRGIDPANAAMIGDSPSDMLTASEVGVAVLVENALTSPGLAESLAEHPNAAVVTGRSGDGWVGFVNALLERREGRSQH